jgi:hypothetical protein
MQCAAVRHEDVVQCSAVCVLLITRPRAVLQARWSEVDGASFPPGRRDVASHVVQKLEAYLSARPRFNSERAPVVAEHSATPGVARCCMFIHELVMANFKELSVQHCVLVEWGDDIFAMLVILCFKKQLWVALGDIHAEGPDNIMTLRFAEAVERLRKTHPRTRLVHKVAASIIHTLRGGRGSARCVGFLI